LYGDVKELNNPFLRKCAYCEGLMLITEKFDEMEDPIHGVCELITANKIQNTENVKN